MTTTNGRCRTCRSWIPVNPDDWPQYDPRHAEPDEPPSPHVMAVAVRNEWGQCELTRMADGEAAHPDSLAVAQDGEGYKAVLVTAPDFGCVQYRPRDTSPFGEPT